MAKFRYVGPYPEAEIHLLSGRTVTVKHNHQFDVSDDEAGSPPDPKLDDVAQALRDAVGANDHNLAARLRDEYAALEKGSGLLAQPENYQPVSGKPKEADK